MTRCPGLLGLTLQAPGCATRSGRAAVPLCRSVQWEAVIRPRRSISLHSTPRHSLPFADGSFDVVFSCFSPSPWDEFCRVLRPGGALPTSLHLAAPLHRCTAVPPHRCTHPPLHSYSLSTARHTSAQLGTPLHTCTPSSGAIIVVRAGATHLQELRAGASADGTWAAREPKEFSAGLAEKYTRFRSEEVLSGAACSK